MIKTAILLASLSHDPALGVVTREVGQKTMQMINEAK